MAEIVLNVEVRERTGTGGARVARREGLVPGILYGGDKAPVAISVKMNEFRKALYTGKLLGHLVTLKYGAETQPVIAKAVDMHPVTDVPTHFDLYRVSANQQIKINVALHFSHHDEAPGLKRGGTLNIVFHDVQVSCAANHIPEDLVVDLTGLDIGSSVRVSDLTFPEGVTPAVPVDTVLATISGASTQADEDEAADTAASEGAVAEAAAEAAAEEAGEA
jgi:large subunit ribosomal protein L25